MHDCYVADSGRIDLVTFTGHWVRNKFLTPRQPQAGSRLFWKSELEVELQGPEAADYGSSLSIANIKLSDGYNWLISVFRFPEQLPPFSFIHYMRSPSPVCCTNNHPQTALIPRRPFIFI
jgi:hypothetical protein